MKRHRGLRRYYRNLTIDNEFEKMRNIDFAHPDTWAYGWHLHFDRSGYGNNSFTKRKPHLDKLFRHFEILIEQVKTVTDGFQLYAIILDYDSSSDALFLHQPNSKGNLFPFKTSDLNPSSNLRNRLLNDYIQQLSGYKVLFGEA